MEDMVKVIELDVVSFFMIYKVINGFIVKVGYFYLVSIYWEFKMF